MSLGTPQANPPTVKNGFSLKLRDLVMWPFGRRRWFRVSGESMVPTFSDGDFVLVNTQAFRNQLSVVGDVVVAKHPYRRSTVVIKRVARIEQGKVELHGDSPRQSTDSRSFGGFGSEALIGRVVGRLK